MNWRQVCADKSLADLPYRIELNRQGQIVMSPISNQHSIHQARIQRRLIELMSGGEAAPEFAIETSDGTKCPDVVWVSASFLKKCRNVFCGPDAPEICVEVLSSSNTAREMQFKRELYFDCHALEVWLCDPKGRMTFFDRAGRLPKSKLCPAFPASVGD